MNSLITKASSNMQKVLQLLHQDLGTVRTGRATPNLVDSIPISVYGGTAQMKIMELATIAASDPRTLVITPFDPSVLDEIQKGIQEANIGFNPANDGKVIRISIPPLSEERRDELIHLMKQKLENGRIMLRQVRQDSFHEVKKAHSTGSGQNSSSDDDRARLEKQIQVLIDDFMATLDAMGEAKEKELRQI